MGLVAQSTTVVTAPRKSGTELHLDSSQWRSPGVHLLPN